MNSYKIDKFNHQDLVYSSTKDLNCRSAWDLQYSQNHIINKMGTSHSKHRQYYESKDRIHGYEKSINKKARSLTVSHHTKKDLIYSADFNKKPDKWRESKGTSNNNNTKKERVVYYSEDDVEMAGQILKQIQSYQNNSRKRKEKQKRTQSQTRLPAYEKPITNYTNSEYIIKVKSDPKQQQQVTIIENLPSNNSILEEPYQKSEALNYKKERWEEKQKNFSIRNGNNLQQKPLKISFTTNQSYKDRNFLAKCDKESKDPGQISQIIQEYYKSFNPSANEQLARKFGLQSRTRQEERAIYLKYQGPYSNEHGSIY